MSIAQLNEAELICKHAKHENDRGSSEVQVVALTARIQKLTTHCKLHKYDHASKRGLSMLVGRRRRHLRYLKKRCRNNYKSLTSDLGLRN